jgi:hypothetical protein
MSRAHRMGIGLILMSLLALAACGSTGGTGNTGGPTGGGGAVAATATPKPKPTAMPKITMVFCQGILTVAEANEIMNPPTQATAIRIDAPSSGGGSCNYEYAPFKAVVSVVFIAVVQPSASLADLAGQAGSQTGGKVTFSPVSGVGDQAEYGVSSTPMNGLVFNFNAMDVLYGSLFFNCNLAYLGTPQSDAEQGKLKQVCQLVVSRL